eukprot:TRINITY_DN18564_c0_g1_i1.p1 TRINITY_DN18564_c0_g1~~TRINITY_DN18564_c0_g1_i1.p1  ORF type:complete len:733 (-),score=265.45 TRINITY_DN18564_c0_g1_i1:231-2429(-)
MKTTTLALLVLALALSASAIRLEDWHTQLERETSRGGKRVSDDGMTAWSGPHAEQESFLSYDGNMYHQYDRNAGLILRDGATVYKRTSDSNKELFTGYIGRKLYHLELTTHKQSSGVWKVTVVSMFDKDHRNVKSAINRSGFNVDAQDKKTLRVTLKTQKGASHPVVIVPRTMNGITVQMSRTGKPVIFWRNRVITATSDRSRMDVGDLVGSIRDFLQFYADQHNKILTGNTVDRLAGTYEELQGMCQPVRDVLRQAIAWAGKTYKRIGASNLNADLWEAMSNAIKDQMGHIEYWAPKIDAIYAADANTPAFVTSQQARAAFQDPVWGEFAKSRARDAQRAKATRSAPKLSEFSRKLLDDGAKAGSKALVKPIAGAARQSFNQNRRYMDPQEAAETEAALKYLESGAFQKEVQGMLVKSFGNSEVVATALNGVGDLIKDAEQTGKNIGDWAKGLFSSKDKKGKVNKAIDNKGGVDPGEKEVVEAFASSRAQAQAQKAAEKKAVVEQQGWKFQAGKFKVDPKFGLGAKGLVKQLNLSWKMEVSSQRMKARMDIDLQVKNPLDPLKASAVARVKVDARGTTRGGVSWAAGATVTAEVTGLYKSPTVDKVGVTWFATAKKGRLSTGVFGSAHIPLSQSALSATNGAGWKADIRASLKYDLSKDMDGSSSFELYGRTSRNARNEFDYAAGARLNLNTDKYGTFYGGIEASGGRSYNGGAFESRNEVRATVGWKITF